jgi:ABC-2 type transport system ATP-binding protein
MTDWAIETHGLGRSFGRVWAVRDLNLKVSPGSVIGLLGPNGAGKSTTIHMLMGLLPSSEGSAQVLGRDPATDDVAVRGKVGFVAEQHGFYELDGSALISELSKGMRARLALLLALSFDPEMLVLDEPTGGLDPAARRTFIETVLGRYQETGKTILVSSHLLNEFSGLLDHVAFLREGHLDLAMPLAELQGRVKRVRLVFEEGVPESLSVPGARSVQSNGREAVAVFDAFDATETPRRLEGVGASRMLIEELTLEDIFVEVLR